MAPLRNLRHERFAQLLANGKGVTDAYEQAGFKRDPGNAAHLAEKPKVTSRVQELTKSILDREQAVTKGAIEREVISRASLIRDARKIYDLAIEKGQTAAAVSALKEIGILAGVRIERLEQGAPGDFDKLSDEELIGRLRATGLDVAPFTGGKPN